ncbi:uncharacterized protein B0P05DRAFT_543411 [Gilbertella persicaria]|uniref:uncharacterized protein n=1 Tax=Gilbertella persicaria TaxID=101096 RepID=UPI00221EA078|nr:uncharacterized protein B0P05DRAFT_543411 [Gilbertella persicaria]KAI8077939.1 hypothetical protein B0P05DRAFT_543411 [Gilbertella persicaria]
MVRTKKEVLSSLSKNRLARRIEEEYQLIMNDKTMQTMATDLYTPKSPVSPTPCTMESLPIMNDFMSRNNLHQPYAIMNDYWPSSTTSTFAASIDGSKISAIQKLQSMFKSLNASEIHEMLTDCNFNEDEVISRLITQTYYLEDIRCRVHQKSSVIGPHSGAAVSQHDPKEIRAPLEEEATVQQQQDTASENNAKSKPAKNNSKNTKSNKVTSNNAPEHDLVLEKYKGRIKVHRNHRRPEVRGRLNLDDALQQMQENQNTQDPFEGWSEARLRAYKMLDKNPNSYYYRFNAPGEQQQKGKWTKEEHQLFLDRLEELGANSQWGIFSMAIPGRVGYQCSNYYRQMIESKQIYDPNYVLDEQGKAHYLFDKKNGVGVTEKIFCKHSKHGSVPATDITKLPKTKNKKRTTSDDEDKDLFVPKKPAIKKKKKISKERPVKNDKQHPSSNIEKSVILACPEGGRITRQRYQNYKKTSK